jgi:CheY-like chemotaxis protein
MRDSSPNAPLILEQLRQLPGMNTALLISISGHGQPRDRQRSEEAGSDFHLVKPADLDQLCTLLANHGNEPGFRHGAPFRAKRLGARPHRPARRRPATPMQIVATFSGQSRGFWVELPPDVIREKPLRIRLNAEERSLVDRAAELKGCSSTSAWGSCGKSYGWHGKPSKGRLTGNFGLDSLAGCSPCPTDVACRHRSRGHIVRDNPSTKEPLPSAAPLLETREVFYRL